ncbi:MAG TPA: barnase inhibitor [Anabaena sp. UBA12330]|jgi:RNAse (barnase) inhibitor barstar|nr:barstar family protein [Aphanizomenon flos-aquae UKL13-PB]HCQ20107.1 barnase inhibitor [Anabaena sp. UBA12330]
MKNHKWSKTSCKSFNPGYPDSDNFINLFPHHKSMNHKVFYLDGKKINSKQTFLKQAAEAMEFPKYFGNNWDAFDECITDLTWCPAQRYVILYDYADIFAQAEPTQYQIALDILNSAKEYWEANHIPLQFLVINK